MSNATTTGNIYSPDYPRNYGNFANCTYVVRVPPVKRTAIRVQFTDFAVEADYDFLYYGAGETPDLAQALGQLDGQGLPEDLAVAGDAMWFWFVSDFSVTFGGFALTWDGTGWLGIQFRVEGRLIDCLIDKLLS